VRLDESPERLQLLGFSDTLAFVLSPYVGQRRGLLALGYRLKARRALGRFQTTLVRGFLDVVGRREVDRFVEFWALACKSAGSCLSPDVLRVEDQVIILLLQLSCLLLCLQVCRHEGVYPFEIAEISELVFVLDVQLLQSELFALVHRCSWLPRQSLVHLCLMLCDVLVLPFPVQVEHLERL